MNESRPELSIIVVSFNTRAMTRACLDSIAAGAPQTSYETIVVDNASTDGSAEMIAAHADVTHFIASPVNLGFAAANNRAAELARGDYILLLNPDTVVLEGAISALMAFARRTPEARLWGGRTLFADGSINATNCFRRLSLWNLFCRAIGLSGLFPASPIFNSEAYGGWDRGTEREVDIVTGCFLLVPASLWHRIGGFDPTFFMYGEEGHLCRMARALGARPRVTPEATIIHHGGASEVTRAEKAIKVLKAKSTLIRRHFSTPLVPIALALNAAWPVTRAAAFWLAGRCLGRPSLTDRARQWSAVWARRDEWLSGYDPARSSPDAQALPAAPIPGGRHAGR
ncbi:MAG: glycosyltransferase family 2 protein [Hyphomicrobiaceae bacterium]